MKAVSFVPPSRARRADRAAPDKLAARDTEWMKDGSTPKHPDAFVGSTRRLNFTRRQYRSVRSAREAKAALSLYYSLSDFLGSGMLFGGRSLPANPPRSLLLSAPSLRSALRYFFPSPYCSRWLLAFLLDCLQAKQLGSEPSFYGLQHGQMCC